MTNTIEEKIDEIARLEKVLTRVYESSQNFVRDLQGILVNATSVADQVFTFETDEVPSSAVKAVRGFFGQAIEFSQERAPDVVAEIEEVAASFDI